jgi:hypothetical protein
MPEKLAGAMAVLCLKSRAASGSVFEVWPLADTDFSIYTIVTILATVLRQI